METKYEAEIDDAALRLISLYKDRYGGTRRPRCNASAELHSKEPECGLKLY